MLKITSLRETDNISPLMLRAFIAKKITSLMEEYNVDTLNDIGCTVQGYSVTATEKMSFFLLR